MQNRREIPIVQGITVPPNQYSSSPVVATATPTAPTYNPHCNNVHYHQSEQGQYYAQPPLDQQRNDDHSTNTSYPQLQQPNTAQSFLAGMLGSQPSVQQQMNITHT
jgi:hypothetical protein